MADSHTSKKNRWPKVDNKPHYVTAHVAENQEWKREMDFIHGPKQQISI